MRRSVAVAFVFAFCLLGGGCGHFRDSDLVGTYTARAEWGTSKLTLNADHAFAQTVSTKSGVLKEVHGKWELDNSGITSAISLTQRYLSVTHDEQGEATGGAFASVDRRLFGGVEISADPDYGITFVKSR